MTTPLESIDILNRLLQEAGFSAASPRFKPVWIAFQHFLQIPVECADSDALCQWGTYTTAPDSFEFDLTRQFSFVTGGKYSGMQQLHCTLSFPASAAVGVDPGCSWASEFPTAAAFCEDLETLEAYYTVSTAAVASTFSVSLEDLPE